MNLVLVETEEFRTTKKSLNSSNPIEEKRNLGMIILRGNNIVSVSVQGEPPISLTGSSRARREPVPSSGAAARNITRVPLSGPVRTGANSIGFGSGGNSQPQFGPPPGFRPPAGFRGR